MHLKWRETFVLEEQSSGKKTDTIQRPPWLKTFSVSARSLCAGKEWETLFRALLHYPSPCYCHGEGCHQTWDKDTMCQPELLSWKVCYLPQGLDWWCCGKILGLLCPSDYYPLLLIQVGNSDTSRKNLEQLKGDCRALGSRVMETQWEHVPAVFSAETLLAEGKTHCEVRTSARLLMLPATIQLPWSWCLTGGWWKTTRKRKTLYNYEREEHLCNHTCWCGEKGFKLGSSDKEDLSPEIREEGMEKVCQ